MSGNFTPAQRKYIRRKSKYHEPSPDELGEELNIIPFLDIVINIIMFLLMSMASIAFFAQVEASLPTYGGIGGGKKEEKPLNLNVTITNSGVIVTGSGGKLAPGCTTTMTGRVVTVPRKGAKYDWAGLTACVREVKRTFPDETKVTISADPNIEYQELLSTMDAVRGEVKGKGGKGNLFPEVLLSAGVR